jgi:flagellar FliL protein
MAEKDAKKKKEMAEAAEAAAAEAFPEEEEGGEQTNRTRMLILGGVAAFAVFAIGGVTTFFLVGGGEDEEAAVAEASAEDAGGHGDSHAGESKGGQDGHGSAGAHDASGQEAVASDFFPLETFIVNIRDGDRDRYLKLKTELELSGDAAGSEISARMPEIKDIVISLLGSKSFEEVRTIEGKNLLREQLMVRINALLNSGKVKRVFFTEFVVQ